MFLQRRQWVLHFTCSNLEYSSLKWHSFEQLVHLSSFKESCVQEEGEYNLQFQRLFVPANSFQHSFNLPSLCPPQSGFEPWADYHLNIEPRKIAITMCLISGEHSQGSVSKNVPQWWSPLKAVDDF